MTHPYLFVGLSDKQRTYARINAAKEVSRNNMTLSNIVAMFNWFFCFDLQTKSRRINYVEARMLYYVYCKNKGCSPRTAANIIGFDRTASIHLNTRYSDMLFTKEINEMIFNDIVYLITNTKFTIDEVISTPNSCRKDTLDYLLRIKSNYDIPRDN